MVTFVDIAGIVKGASEGEGLGNKFLAAIRESDAICQVVRVFEDPDVIHVDGRIEPSGDIETINTELILADLQTVDSRIVKLAKESRKQPELVPAAEGGRAGPRDPGRRPDGGLGRRRRRDRRRPGARPAPAQRQAVHLRLQRRRGRPGRRVAEGAAPGAGGPGRVRRAVRPDRGGGGRPRPRGRRRAPGRLRPGRVRPGAAGPRRLPHPRAPDLPDGRARRRRGPGRSTSATRPPRRRA